MLFRNHPVSLIIRLRVRLLQMDILKSDQVYFRYTLQNGEKGAIYHTLPDLFQYLNTHIRVHYEAYYPSKEFRLDGLIDKPEFTNKNRLRALRGL